MLVPALSAEPSVAFPVLRTAAVRGCAGLRGPAWTLICRVHIALPSLLLPPRCTASGLCRCSFLCLECSSLPSSCLNYQLGSETSGSSLLCRSNHNFLCEFWSSLPFACVCVCMCMCFLYPQLLVQPFAHNWLSEKACWIMDGGHGVLLRKYFPNLPGRDTAFIQWFRLPPYPTKNVSVWKTAQFVFVGCFGPLPDPPKVHFHTSLLLEGHF